MSGIAAAAQSSGCCCRPQGCVCTNPNRPGALIDRQLTAINIEAELDVREELRQDGCPNLGCQCSCFASFPQYGPPGGPFYSYVSAGSIVDPDFVEGTPCESLACKPGCCASCPTIKISANFGSHVLHQHGAGLQSWGTLFTEVADNQVGSWNWQARQVGYCTDPNSGIRIRRFCIGPFGGWISSPFPGSPAQPQMLINYNPAGVDPNGAYIDANGRYTGANIGRCNAYAFASVQYGQDFNGQCGYTATIAIAYMFSDLLRDLLVARQGRWAPYAFIGDTSVQTPFIVATYFKPCLSPSDTVMGEYIGSNEPILVEWTDPECGSIRGYYVFDMTFPSRIRIS